MARDVKNWDIFLTPEKKKNGFSRISNVKKTVVFPWEIPWFSSSIL